MENIVAFNMEAHCEAILRNAKEMNGIKFAELPLDLLILDEEYQRPEHDWRKIATNWNDRLVGTIICSYRDCNFYVIDGATRCRAARYIGKETINAIIYTGLTVDEEAILFARQDENKKRVSLNEKFNAYRVANDEETIAINAICKEFHLKPVRDRSNTAVYLSSITGVIQMYRTCGADGLRWAFDIIRSCGWHGARNGYGDVIMATLRYVYVHFGAAARQAVIQIFKDATPNILIAQAQVFTGIQGAKRAMVSYMDRELTRRATPSQANAKRVG